MQTNIETTGTVGSNRSLLLDEDIPVEVSKRVRVIVIFDEDLPEDEWNRAAAANDVFAFLNDDDEDIYSIEDGTPI